MKEKKQKEKIIHLLFNTHNLQNFRRLFILQFQATSYNLKNIILKYSSILLEYFRIFIDHVRATIKRTRN